jgi:hypothetical protein
VRLTELNPRWVGKGGEGVFRTNAQGELEPAPRREGVGIIMACPCRGADCPSLYVPFDRPLDGGPPIDAHNWTRTGDTFETLSLTPSIQRIGGCGWHGFITNGEVIKA